MKKRFYFVSVLFIAFLIFINAATAHDPMEVWLSDAKVYYENMEKDLNAAVTNLNRLDSIQRGIKGEWDDNNEDMRSGSLSALGAIADLSIGSFITAAGEAGLDLQESMSLTSALDAAISQVQSQYNKTRSLERSRSSALSILLYFYDIHNSFHDTPSDDYTMFPTATPHVITKTTYVFPCAGGCSMPMDSPISPHLTSCPECDDDYHSCNAGDFKRHKPRTCDKNIKYTYSFNGKVYSKRCGRGFRNCKNPRFLHNQYLSGTFLEFSTKHADNEDDEANAGGTDVMHACDIHDTSVPGDHSSTYLCNVSPCSNRQVLYCLALCPYTDTHGSHIE